MTDEEQEQLQRDLAYLMDRQAILDCIASHAHGHDRHDSEVITAAYHDDGTDEHGNAVNPGPKYAEWINPVHAAGSQNHLHNITTHTCEIDGDVAHAESYVLVTLLDHDAQTARFINGRYLDRLEKRDGVWRIAVRRSTVELMIVGDASGLQHPMFTAEGYGKGTRDASDLSYARPLEIDTPAPAFGDGVSDDCFEGVDFLADPSLAADPYPYYDWLHQCPVWRESTHGVVMVSGYDEAVSVWRDDKETFSACNVVSGPFPGLPVPPEGDDISSLIAEYRDTLPLHEFFASFDPPEHTDHRSLLMRLLTPKRLQENEEFLWRLADQQIDTFVDQGTCEFVRAFGNPFTMLAIADLLGVPEHDRGRFGRANQLIGNLENETFEPASIQNMERWFVEYVEERRREPRDDVLTHLALGTFPDGSTPAAVDVARVATFLFAAGQGTTVDLLSSALLMLAERPALQELVRDDPAQISAFVEEMLRYESPIKSNFRLVARTTSLGDVELPAGTNVLVMNGAANRDARRFEDPNDFRLDRPNVGEHLAFGRGIHACPGAPLARAEARIALERLLNRLGDIRIDEAQHGPSDDRHYEWEPTFLLRRLRALHLEFTPSS